MKGDSDLQEVHFHKEEDIKGDKIAETEYVITPDMVICANGLALPRR